MYYFKKEKDSAPAGIIPLDYYVISAKVQQKKKKYAMVLRINGNHFKTLTTMFKLQAESEPAYEDWYQKIKDKVRQSLIFLFNFDQSKKYKTITIELLKVNSDSVMTNERFFFSV